MTDKYIYRDDKSGTAYWIEDNWFMSAPLFKDGRVDYGMKIPLSDWENMEPFWENSSNFTDLILILEKLLERH
tara:strand:+ start:338 stop:556 length:219 start_codon:yes stop_codon:yes gene_type:complete